MRAETRRVLERVVAKAARLKESAFLAELERGGWSISFRRREVLVTRPPDEARDAFVLNLRFFIVGNEATSFRSLANLVSDPGVSAEWQTRFELLREAVNDNLAAVYGQYVYGGSSDTFSNGQILDTFLYGGLVHANNADAVARFEEWARFPGIAALVELRFITTIKSLCIAIFLLAEMSKEELDRGE